MINKDITVNTRTSVEEKAKIKKAAESIGLSISAFVRMSSISEAKKILLRDGITDGK